jgi:hypothetical protein
MTVKASGWRRNGFRKADSAGGRKLTTTAALQAHQAQLLLAAGNPNTPAAPVWKNLS